MDKDLVQAFVDAFNAEDLEALAMVLDDDVVLIGQRGRIVGIDAVKKWATRIPGGDLHQHLVVDNVTRTGPGDRMVADVRRQWLWKEGGGIADESHLKITVEAREGRITHWEIEQP